MRSRYGHRIRLATHSGLHDLVTENGLGYYEVGLPSGRSSRFIRMMQWPDLLHLLTAFWVSCTDLSHMPRGRKPQSDTVNFPNSNIGNSASPPFVANAIVANPNSLAGMHIAEKLGSSASYDKYPSVDADPAVRTPTDEGFNFMIRIDERRASFRTTWSRRLPGTIRVQQCCSERFSDQCTVSRTA